MGMATQQKSKASPRGRATERRDRKATEKKADKKTRRKEWRAKKRKQVDSREEYNPKHGEEEDEEEPAKKKKKKKGKKEQLGPDGEPLPQKLTVGGLKPKLWDSPGVVIRKGGKFEAGVGATLLPFRRDVRCAPGPDEPQLDEAATAELRKLLRLRVPEQRTRVCRFWQQGNCSRGDACGFAHANATDGPAAARCPPPVQSLADRTLPKLIGRAMPPTLALTLALTLAGALALILAPIPYPASHQARDAAPWLLTADARPVAGLARRASRARPALPRTDRQRQEG